MRDVFKALADPTRREILSRLARGSMTAGEIWGVFPISRASLSHHFNVLKSADLVRTERRGQTIVYSLNTSVVDEIMVAVLDIFEPKSKASSTRRAKAPR
jgi:DNA-binding transcriptional ArsR family regulator